MLSPCLFASLILLLCFNPLLVLWIFSLIEIFGGGNRNSNHNLCMIQYPQSSYENLDNLVKHNYTSVSKFEACFYALTSVNYTPELEQKSISMFMLSSQDLYLKLPQQYNMYRERKEKESETISS